MIGTKINDRYRLDAELGRGGMGTVYRAHDTVLKRDVAVKILSGEKLGTEGRSRLLQEAQLTAGLNHPNIVTIFDAGEEADSPYLVMELVSGKTLRDQPPQSFDEMVEIISQVCRALEHAHNSGIIHRDLKPENIMIQPNGIARLMDFGLARSVASRMTTEGTIRGTVFYIAPEQALGKPIDQRVDLYALGVMLYEMLTGELPFIADNAVAVVTQHILAPVVPPRAKRGDIPIYLDRLVVDLLSKEPEERPASAAEVLARLKKTPGKDILIAEEQEELTFLDRIVRGRMVGREKELKQAGAMWRKARGRDGDVLLISGEPGVGKTRLVQEIITHAEVSGGMALVGACYAEGGAPYAAFGEIVHRGIERGNGELNLPNFVMADLLKLAPSLKINYPDVEPNPTLTPEYEQGRLFENAITFCKALSESFPLLLVLEDAHWGDSGTLSLLRYLARRIRRMRVLILVTYREVELDLDRPFNQVLADLNRERLAAHIKLGRLGREEARRMLGALFAAEIKDPFLDGIYSVTEGNPFFTEEVCKSLVENGGIWYEGGEWRHLENMSEMEIPQSVRVAIQSRLGRFSRETQEVLQMAAVLGREFEFEALLDMSGVAENVLIDALESAERGQLIGEIRGKDRVTFAFNHALIPATLAEGLSTLRRRRTHAAAAAVMERNRPEDYEVLAYHYGLAGNREQALKYYTLAGEKALQAYANREAEVFFTAALDLVEIKAKRAHLLAELGEALFGQSRFDEAIEVWRKGITLFRELEDMDQTARLYDRYAKALWCIHDTPGSLAICREGLKAVEGAPDSEGYAALLNETAGLCFFNDLTEEILPLCERALAMAERIGSVRAQVVALTYKCLAPLRSRYEYKVEEISAIYKRAIELAEPAGLYYEAARAYNNLGDMLATWDPHPALRYFQKAAELWLQIGFDYGLILATNNVISTYVSLGDLAKAEEACAALENTLIERSASQMVLESLSETKKFFLGARGDLEEAVEDLFIQWQTAVDTGDLQSVGIKGCWLGELLLEMGRTSDAEEVLLTIVERGIKNRLHGTVTPRSLLAVKSIQEGELEEARRWLDEAFELYDELNPEKELEYYKSLGVRARLLAAEERWEEAQSVFEEVVEKLRETGFHPEKAHLIRHWAEAYLARGEENDRARALEMLAEVKAEYEEMGATGWSRRVAARMQEIEGS